MSKKNIREQSLPELKEYFEGMGDKKFRAMQAYEWLWKKNARSFGEMSNLSLELREKLAGEFELNPITVDTTQHSSDGTLKSRFKTYDGHLMEGVLIPTEKRFTACVSSQIGCSLTCRFCATGQMDRIRNLGFDEIYDQVAILNEQCQETYGHGLTNIVYMGMGEPLLNLKELIKAVKCLNQDVGIGQRSQTISTVGLPGKIRELADQQLQTTLAVSLHAANQMLRQQLIPSAEHYPLAKLLSECKEYVAITGRRITFEYVLLSGINDLPGHATELAKILRGFQTHVNLIPYNPIKEADYRRPTEVAINRFAESLQKENIAVSVRYSRGLETDAACGQLRSSSIPREIAPQKA